MIRLVIKKDCVMLESEKQISKRLEEKLDANKEKVENIAKDLSFSVLLIENGVFIIERFLEKGEFDIAEEEKKLERDHDFLIRAIDSEPEEKTEEEEEEDAKQKSPEVKQVEQIMGDKNYLVVFVNQECDELEVDGTFNPLQLIFVSKILQKIAHEKILAEIS